MPWIEGATVTRSMLVQTQKTGGVTRRDDDDDDKRKHKKDSFSREVEKLYDNERGSFTGIEVLECMKYERWKVGRDL